LDIEIDGGSGEGGGQIVRTAVGLACALGRSVCIREIRKGRRQPGLRAQHIAGIELAAEMCDAEVSGLEIGSTEVGFRPVSNTGGRFEIDVGTAGSVSLVLQTCMIPAVTAKGPTELLIRGGTDVPWSPPIDYLRMVVLPLLQSMGADAELSVAQRGFYPAGGGEVVARVSPCGGLKGADLTSRGDLIGMEGSIVCRNLPDHVVERARNAAAKGLAGHRTPRFSVDSAKGPSTGLSLVLAARFENSVMGASCLGEKGLPAEKVGEIAARDLLEEMSSGAALDAYASDQMVPFMFLASGSSRFTASELTAHARTNLRVAGQFVRRKVATEESDDSVLVSIE